MPKSNETKRYSDMRVCFLTTVFIANIFPLPNLFLTIKELFLRETRKFSLRDMRRCEQGKENTPHLPLPSHTPAQPTEMHSWFEDLGWNLPELSAILDITV